MSEESKPPKTKQQVMDQYRVVVHLARALATVHEDSIKLYERWDMSEGMIDLLGNRSAAFMEMLGDILNELDAIDEEEDGWTHPIFKAAQALWPKSGRKP